MIERATVGEVPAKHHTILREGGAADGALRYEHCLTRQGFDGAYSILYHRSLPPRDVGHRLSALAPDPHFGPLPASGPDAALHRRHLISSRLYDRESRSGSAVVDRESRGGSAVDGAERLRIERTGAARAPLLADPDKLRQVLRNLLRNAAQAMDGRGLLSVAVTTNRRSVSVLVSDDGPGITGQLSRRLFEPFATTKEGGTGLGLVISRRIAEQHGGSLELLPSSQGAHFLLTVPRRPQQPIPSGERTESDG